MRRNLCTITGVALALVAGTAFAKATPAQTCESAKNTLAGQYDACRQKAYSKFASTGDAAARTAALQKCLDKYAAKWPLTESKAVAAGGACPSTGDQAAIQGVIDTTTTNIATELAGGVLPAALPGQVLKTGQTTCYDASGAVTPCAGTGQDGELQKGLARAYVDNGDGTITDTNTGLMWEKLSSDGSIHDMTTLYTWTNAFAVKVAALNGGGGFAGHTDWRVPNVNELHSIVSYGAFSPAVFPAFNTVCAPACTVLTCSCTISTFYWSSDTYPAATLGWAVSFNDGDVIGGDETIRLGVRAVRGGS